MKKNASIYLPLASLVVIFVFLGIFLFSYDQYPIDDDWSYIKAAETFHQTGEMKFTPWTAMSLVFQIWWGTCFTKLFGYSVEMLRVSTLAISLLGLIFFYLLLREFQYQWYTCLGMVLLVLFNPLSFPLNFTFFTDHFYISLLLIATYCCIKSFKYNSNVYLLIASLVSTFAVLVRQNGILLPLSAFICLLLRERPLKTIIKKGSIILVLPLAGLIVFTYWYNVIHGPTFEYIRHVDSMLENLRKPYLFLIKLVWRPLIVLEFIGFCCVPFSFALLSPVKGRAHRFPPRFLPVFFLMVSIFYLLFDYIGLYSTAEQLLNGFHYSYISEYGFRDHINILFFFYRIFDFLSVASIVYLIYLALTHRKTIMEKFTRVSPSFLIIVIGILQFLYLMVARFKFSRYYVVLIPYIIIILLEITRHVRISKKIFIPLLAFYGMVSFAIVQDMMSWNQLKWRMANQLNAKGISAQSISAGFAWDAWHSCQYSREHPYEIAVQKGDVPWWIDWVIPAVDPRYLVSSSTIPSGREYVSYFEPDKYNVIDSARYFSLFYGREMDLYVLEREPRSAACPEGIPFYNFLLNLRGARVRSGNGISAIEPIFVDLDGTRKSAWLQYPYSKVSFRVKLPQGRCRLRASLGINPACWDKPGDGVVYRILVNDVLLENLFQSIGTIATMQKREFFQPQTYFFQPRTYFVQYVDPKNKPGERKWQDLCLDLSAFAGKIIDVTFEIDAGPLLDDRNDEALWAKPVIESY